MTRVTRGPVRPAVGGFPLEFRLEVPEEVGLGHPVPIRLVLTNAGDRAVQVWLGGRPTRFDIIVTAADGAVVWQRLHGRYTSSVATVGPPMAPGQSAAFQDTWDQRTNAGEPVPPGKYHVRGTLGARADGPPARVAGDLMTETKSLRILRF